MRKLLSLILESTIALTLIVGLSKPVFAGDWPMWRFDAGHTAYTPHSLPSSFHLQWTRQFPKQRPAWPVSQTKLQFDHAYQPVVADHAVFVGSTVDDSLSAYHTSDGRLLWRFFTDGPIRFAPAVANGRVYVVSDDGFLYCLEADSGQLLWKVRGGPFARKILGNGRLISTWPARGGPVIADGVVYFAAGIWPSMGIFIHAVDAKTGRILWTNSKTGSLYVVHPHGAPSFGSIVPQGTLTVSGEYLIVPGGRSTPAVFNRKTGKLKHFHFDRRTGDYRVISRGDYYFLAGHRYDLTEGDHLGDGIPEILTENSVIEFNGKQIVCKELKGQLKRKIGRDRKGRIRILKSFSAKTLWSMTPSKGIPGKPFLQAGQQIFTAGNGRVASFRVPSSKEEAEKVRPFWTTKVEGDVRSMVAADGRLFVVTAGGTIHCFGSQKIASPRIHHLQSIKPVAQQRTSADSVSKLAEQILQITGAERRPARKSTAKNSASEPAYAILLGLDAENRLALELAKRSNHRVIAIDSDKERVAQFRTAMQKRGAYGTDVAALEGTLSSVVLPPYLTSLMVIANPNRAGFSSSSSSLQKLFQTLRPYGGVACLQLSDDEHRKFIEAVQNSGLKNANVSRQKNWTLLRRVGALPKSASWTHQYGDGSNSVVSRDELVKAPLGVLWFGGPPNDKILPRHGHGPSPQVAGGRLFIEGPDILRAVDVYTGRLLWETELKGLGKYYNVTRHFAGAGEIGSNYVSLADAVYVVYGGRLLELDAKSGELKKEFSLPDQKGDEHPNWGHISVEGDFVVVTSTPVKLQEAKSEGQELFKPVPYSSASRRLVVFHRKTGKLLWSRTAEFSFRHNCISVADNRVFCIDGLSPAKINMLKRRGIHASGRGKLLALDLKTGRVIWSQKKGVTGTFLNYSRQHDVLLQAGSAYRDRARDEISTGMTAYRGRDGKVLWRDDSIRYNGPCLLWRDKIITNGSGGFQLELLTGKKTGWSYSRMYGCNTAVGSEHLLTFRSGAAGFCDLTNDSGTGNIGGFRSSCTANLIAADGVLNAPDYTRTCSCAYQHQTSLALVHMPENEYWTFNNRKLESELQTRLGLNLGAPGDRRSPNGTLFLDVPSVGGPSPDISVTFSPKNIRWYHRHSSEMKGNNLKWVGATGGEGIRQLTITNRSPSSARKTSLVRLYFSEPTDAKPGERLFSVAIQGKTVLNGMDVVKSAGGANRTIVREFPNISFKKTLQIQLTPEKNSQRPPVLSGVELIHTGNR
ncbi:MAG: hypothetical protein Tsb009_10160 [Planctomycetaceae bacterium]